MKIIACAVAFFSAIAVQLAMPQAGNTGTPLLANGTVNLGPIQGEKGVWEIPYIENIANFVVPVPANFGRSRRTSGKCDRASSSTILDRASTPAHYVLPAKPLHDTPVRASRSQ